LRTVFHLTFEGWEPRFFGRLGSFSLLLDFQADLFEVNGRPLRWFGRTSGDVNPLEGLDEETPLEPPEDPRLEGLARALRRFAEGRPATPQWISFKLLGGIALVWGFVAKLLAPLGTSWLFWRFSWEIQAWTLLPILLMAGLALQALALRVRGLSAIAYGGLWWVAVAGQGHAVLGLLVFPLIFTAALSRFINPWLGATGVLVLLGPREGVFLLVLPWLAMAAFLTLQEVRRSGRRLEILPGRSQSDLARGAEALSKTRIWRQDEAGLLSDAFALRASEIALPGGAPIWFLEAGAECLCFLPGALLWIRAGLRAELVPMEAVVLSSQPCTWENPSEELELGPEQWMIHLQLPGRPGNWTLLVADAVWGRRATAAWARAMAHSASGGAEPGPAPSMAQGIGADLRAAYRALGLAPGASPSQVRDAYRRLAKTYHPDAHPEAAASARAEYETRMQAINEAYAQLKNEAAA
jgi:hypothetical protein